jgi:hypothetical protein
MMSLYWNKVVVLGIPDKPFSAESVVDCLSNLEAQSAALPPSILDEMSQSQDATALLARLNRVTVVGGTCFTIRYCWRNTTLIQTTGQLSEEIGNRLVKNGVVLQNAMGTTE